MDAIVAMLRRLPSASNARATDDDGAILHRKVGLARRNSPTREPRGGFLFFVLSSLHRHDSYSGGDALTSIPVSFWAKHHNGGLC
jgi:hypothetical protein